MLGGVAALCLGGLQVPALAEDEIGAALMNGKPIIDVRARAEFADQDGFAEDAEAYTLRARLGFQTGEAYGFSVLAELESVISLGPENYNSTANGRGTYPVIADPEDTELNRLQLTYKGIPGTEAVLGRQRIIFDDARFIGNVGWRQNEQTFDAGLVRNTSLPGLTATYAYIDQVNRIFSRESAQGTFTSDSHAITLNYSGVEGLSVSGFGYLLDLEEAPLLSTATYGVRGAYKTALSPDWSLNFAGSYAHQEDYGDNPASVSLDYYMAEAGAAYGGFNGGLGYEVLEGDGTLGFSTPLATLHAFQGWADAFLTTPADGIEDFSASLGYAFPLDGFVKKIGTALVWHDFRSERGSDGLGQEIDAALNLFLDNGITLTAKYADFDGDAAGPADREKIWFQIAYSY